MKTKIAMNNIHRLLLIGILCAVFASCGANHEKNDTMTKDRLMREAIRLSVSGRCLRIIPETSDGRPSLLPVRVLTTDGRLCVGSEVCGASPTDIDLSQLPAGIYVVRIGSSCHKIALH